MVDQLQPIIVKKIIKKGGGHSGGAWKIAYADFVTAMMAFFLLLWLLNAVTQEQLEGIADHFSPVSVSRENSGSDGVLGGKVLAEEGAKTATTSRTSVTMDLPPPRAGAGGDSAVNSEPETDSPPPEAAAAEEAQKKLEEEQFKKAEKELKEAIKSIPSLRQLKDSLLIDNTPEGLRIQLVDQKGLAMFPSGGANMFLHTKKLLELVSKVILSMPQKLAISGHTDAVKFVSDTGYSNWELSSDRANASRRQLIHSGVPYDRISRVVGKADTEPLLKDDPKNPKNRRLSIILLRGTGHNKVVAPQPKEEPPEETYVPPSVLPESGHSLVIPPSPPPAEEAH